MLLTQQKEASEKQKLLRKGRAISSHLNLLKVLANEPRNGRSRSYRLHKQAEAEAQEKDEEFKVPDGQLQRNIDNYCKKYCNLELVIENKKEKDSWGQMSVKGMVGK